MNFIEIQKLMTSYSEKYKSTGKSATQIAEQLLEDYPEIKKDHSLQHIALMIYENLSEEIDPMAAGEKNPTLDDNGHELDFSSGKDKYEIVDDHYVWNTKRAGTIKLSIKQANQLFSEYSVYGLNMSQEEVRRKHGFTIPEWNSIKSTLWLYKKSHIFSPYTADNTPQNELQEMMTDALEKKYTDQNGLIEDEYRKYTLKQYKKIIKKYQVDKFASKEFLDDLHSMMPNHKVINVKEYASRAEDPDEIFASIADLHVGAKTIGLKLTPDFDLKILNARLADAAIAINAQKGKKVTIGVLGDLIESFTGLNHENSWQSMEFGAYGAKAVVMAFETLSTFFDQINNLKTIKLIGGNHDRSTSNNKIDRKTTVAEIVFFMLQQKYGTIYNLEYDTMVLTHDLGEKIKLILAHGDRRILKKAGTSLDSKVIEFGDKEKFNVILTGHLHSRGVNEDKVHYRWYKVPSIFSGNFYSEENGWNALPGMMIITEDHKSKLPIVIDYPLTS